MNIIYSVVNCLKDISKSRTGIGTDAVDEFMPGGEVELYAGNPGAILAAVMLLLHHQVQFLQAVKCSPVFGQVIFGRLKEPDQCNAAFVPDGFAHSSFLRGAKVSNLWIGGFEDLKI